MISNILKKYFGAVSGSDSTMTVDEDGDKRWENAKGQLHRLDGPACEWPSGTKEWWVDGKCHRLDGPAFERANGEKAWWVDGNKLTEAAFNQHPAVLEFRRGRQAELEATEKAEAKRKLDDMHKVLGAVVRDFHRKIGGPQ